MSIKCLRHIISRLRYLKHSPTHVPQSPAPGEPSGLSKWPLIKTDESASFESLDDILSLNRNYTILPASVAHVEIQSSQTQLSSVFYS